MYKVELAGAHLLSWALCRVVKCSYKIYFKLAPWAQYGEKLTGVETSLYQSSWYVRTGIAVKVYTPSGNWNGNILDLSIRPSLMSCILRTGFWFGDFAWMRLGQKRKLTRGDLDSQNQGGVSTQSTPEVKGRTSPCCYVTLLDWVNWFSILEVTLCAFWALETRARETEISKGEARSREIEILLILRGFWSYE